MMPAGNSGVYTNCLWTECAPSKDRMLAKCTLQSRLDGFHCKDYFWFEFDPSLIGQLAIFHDHFRVQICIHDVSVSEIKCARCTGCALFLGWVSDFFWCFFFLGHYLKYGFILEGCLEKFPGAQFWEKCTLQVHEIQC